MKHFTLGILVGALGYTILTSVSELVISLTEVAKARMGCTLVSYNEKIKAMSSDTDNGSATRAIGFSTTNEKEDDDAT